MQPNRFDELQRNTRYFAFNPDLPNSPSCIAFNFGKKTWSYDTPTELHKAQPLESLQILKSKRTTIFSSKTLSTASTYLMAANECLEGAEKFSNQPQNSASIRKLLLQLSVASNEILGMPETMAESIDTALAKTHRSYITKRESNDKKHEAMKCVLDDLDMAVQRYIRIPRLVPFNIPKKRRQTKPKNRGAVFTHWAINRSPKALVDGSLGMIPRAEEVKPLHMARFKWKTSSPSVDFRKKSIDLIAEYERNPVVVEVKMNRDSWTFESIPQLLWYGAMMTSPHQLARFSGVGIPNASRLWLALVSETRRTPGYLEDHENAIQWCEQSMVKKRLSKYFAGLFFVRIAEHPKKRGWWIAEDEQKITFA